MKKVLFTILCIGILQTSFSQKKDTLNGQRKSFSVEPLIGLGTSEAVQNGSNNLGGRIGCGLVYMFNEHWGVSSGLELERYSTKVVSGTDSEYFYEGGGAPSYWEAVTVHANYDFYYIQLPLLLKYISSEDSKIGIFAEAGFIIGYSIAKMESGEINGIATDTTKGNPFTKNGSPAGYELTNSFTLPNVEANTNLLNISCHFAFGITVPINQKWSLISDISINRGAINIGNSSNDVVNIYGVAPFYYYNKSKNFSNQEFSNYGTNFSAMFNIRVNIKLQ